MSFVHLHTHSHYSLLDGLSKVKDLVKEAVRMEMPALAITDHGNMYGAIEFYKEAQKAGIKPIIGLEGYVAARSLHDKEPGIDERRYHITLLAENNEGYHNLIELVTTSHLEGFYYKPRVDKEILRKDFETAERLVAEYKDIFGKENFFLETSHHPNIPNHVDIQNAIQELARKTRTPLVATQDSHYLRPDDAQAQDVLLAVQTNTRIENEDRLTMKADDFSFRSPEEMRKFFKDLPEATRNTLEIANRINLTIPMGILQLPHFDVPKGFTAEKYLAYLCHERLTRRYKNVTLEVKERLEYELGVINKTGFSTYFLIV